MGPGHRVLGALGALLVGALGAAGCASRTLPPFGQAHITVTTDAPVPAVVARLRIDVYAEDGRWTESRDLALRDAAAWPASFTIYSSGAGPSRRARVRVRGYRDGAVRDYRGERFLAAPPASVAPSALPTPPKGDGEPRLVVDGVDVTPPLEPAPEPAIDRLAWVDLAEGEVREVHVALRTACAGTMADLAGDRTCLALRGELVDTRAAPSEPSSVAEPPAWASALEAAGPVVPRPAHTNGAGVPLFDDEVLVPGGVVVLGATTQFTQSATGATSLDAAPERVFVVPALLVDRYEVTVARYRDAVRRGFVPPEPPVANDAPSFDPRDMFGSGMCTFSASPLAGAASRETLPLTCIAHATARALCRFEGGDLPTEAEWEYVATTAGRASETAFPWGDALPESCADVVLGRMPAISGDGPRAVPRTSCSDGGAVGPLPVPSGVRDETPAGVHGMGGNVGEWVRDTPVSFAAACWARAPLVDPLCETTPGAFVASARGSSWNADVPLPAASRSATDGSPAPDVGVRCTRKP